MLSAVPIPRDEDICGDIHLCVKPLKLNPETLLPTELNPNLVLANKYQFDLDDTEIFEPEIWEVAVHPDKLKPRVQDGLITIWASNIEEALLELNKYQFKPDWISPPGDTIKDLMED
jgi:hypothetical protein